jgi:hypothetical protein
VQYSTQPPGRDGVELMVREYLSAAHRDSPQDGCPSAALLAEIGRCGDATRRAYTEGVLAIAGEIAGRLAPDDPPSARGTTLGLFALLIGTMQLSRALADRELADEVLEQGLRNALVLTDAGERAGRMVLRAGRPLSPGGLRRAGRRGVRCPAARPCRSFRERSGRWRRPRSASPRAAGGRGGGQTKYGGKRQWAGQRPVSR